MRPKSLAMKTVDWPCASAPSIHYSARGESVRARARDVGRSEQRVRSEACGQETRGLERAVLAERGKRSFCLCGWFDASDGNGASERPKQSITEKKT
jgi:hypothetical protein